MALNPSRWSQHWIRPEVTSVESVQALLRKNCWGCSLPVPLLNPRTRPDGEKNPSCHECSCHKLWENLWDTSGAAEERSFSHCPSLRFFSARTICVFCCVSVVFQMNHFVWKFFLIDLIWRVCKTPNTKTEELYLMVLPWYLWSRLCHYLRQWQLGWA